MPNRDYWTVFYESDGAPFVHFSLELDPEDVTFRRSGDETQYEARLQVDIDVRSRSGVTVTVPSRDAFLRIDAGELERVRAFPLAYQDSFPLIPGAYQLAVTLRSHPGERFTVSERNRSVPELPRRGPALGAKVQDGRSHQRHLHERARRDAHRARSPIRCP